MRGLAMLSIVTLATGCDVIFGLKPVQMPDAAVDAPPIDAGPDASSCLSFDLPTDADAEMIAAAGGLDQGHGNEAILNVGVAVKSEGLWRFQIPTGGRIASLALHVPIAPSAHACGSGGQCGSCTAIDRSGHFDVAFARSDWDETTVCFNRRATGMNWATVGARGAADRSPIVGSATYTAATDLSIDLDPAMVSSWITTNDLSMILTPSAGAVVVAPQKQFAVADAACNPSQIGVLLAITICQ